MPGHLVNLMLEREPWAKVRSLVLSPRCRPAERPQTLTPPHREPRFPRLRGEGVARSRAVVLRGWSPRLSLGQSDFRKCYLPFSLSGSQRGCSGVFQRPGNL